jgi:hypothetical protein
MNKAYRGLVNYLTLFSSLSTLICCALPALLVSLGLGAVMAGLASNVPGLIWASENKNWIFGFAGILLLSNGVLLWKNRTTTCPVDPRLSQSCRNGKHYSKNFYTLSVVFFLIAITFSFILPLY